MPAAVEPARRRVGHERVTTCARSVVSTAQQLDCRCMANHNIHSCKETHKLKIGMREVTEALDSFRDFLTQVHTHKFARWVMLTELRT